jgi:hypothetical protein
MNRVLNALIARKFDDVRGARIAGTIPVNEKVLNEAASRRIFQTRGRIQQFDIQIGTGNYLQVGMKVAVGPFSKWFRPEVTVAAQAQPALLAVTLASREYAALMWLVELFAKELFPRGLTIRGKQVIVDIGALPAFEQYKDLLPYIKKFDISSTRGVLAIAVEISID